MSHKILSVVLTGGPCAGKSTALSFLEERLTSLGVHALLVPETATSLIMGGIRPWEIGPESFQVGVIQTQLAMEENFRQFAADLAKKSPVVIIHDRGLLDGRAYCSPEVWKQVTQKAGINYLQERDTRYDAVIHMTTAALGAEKFYTLDNNQARKESPQEAIEADRRTMEAWCGHPKWRLVDNSTSFQQKICRVGQIVADALGIPYPIEAERKYLLPADAPKKLAQANLPFTSVQLSQTYLLAPSGEERRVRERRQADSVTYFYTTKKPLRAGERIEEEKLITKEAYQMLLEQKDPTLEPVEKTRHYFVYEGHYMELDEYHKPVVDYSTLEVETKEIPELPMFLGRTQDVTGRKEYSNFHLSQIAAAQMPEI